jgi:hypothetical protein
VKHRAALAILAIRCQHSAVSSYPEMRCASQDTSDDLLLLAVFFSLSAERGAS